MYSPPKHNTRSPPPLQHPIPTHPPRQVPEPSHTPTLSSGATSAGETHVTSATSRRGGGNPSSSSSSSAAAAGASLGAQTSSTHYARYSSPAPSSGGLSEHPPPIQQQYQSYGGSTNDGSGAAAYGTSPSFGTAMSNDGYGYGGGGSSAASSSTGYYRSSSEQQRQQRSGQPGGNSNAGFGNFGNFMGSNDPNVNMTAQMGLHFGQQMASVGGEYVQRNIGTWLPTFASLRPLFNVSNSYVLHKLRIIVFPWKHRPWSRAFRAPGSGGHAVGGVAPTAVFASRGGNANETDWQSHSKRPVVEGYAPPREDVNAPDLYIPVMAFVTYVLLVAVIIGLSGKFRPEILGLTSGRAFFVILFELILIRLVLYLYNIQGSDYTGYLDLMSYAGYKFVPACITLAATAARWPGWMWWGTFAYCYAALAFFLLRSLRHIILPDPSLASSQSSFGSSVGGVAIISPSQRSRRVQILFLIAVLQFAVGGVLCFRVTG